MVNLRRWFWNGFRCSWARWGGIDYAGNMLNPILSAIVVSNFLLGVVPAGIQIVAPMWADATSIECAALLSDVVGGFVPPPAFQE